MKKLVSRRVGIGLLSAAVTVGLAGVSAYATAAENAPSATGDTVRLVVGVKPGADPAAPVRSLSARVAAAAQAPDARLQAALAAVGARAVEVPADARDSVIAELRKDPNVRYVDVAHPVKAYDVTPNDPVFADGFQPELARLNIPKAWDATTGSPVTVAVVDTGVSAGPDLSGALVDGWDFINWDGDATDDNELVLNRTTGLTLGIGHGTLVASLLAARGDNAVGRAGVCWSCQILPVKVLDENGNGDDVTVAAGIIFAADMGAKIINVSLGGPDHSDTLADAVSYANGKGAAIVAAAGNDGTDARGYPAAYAGVLAVGGAGAGDARDPGSNFGSDWVDVAAPYRVWARASDGRYYSIPGTSFSTPLTAGVAALVKANNPSYNGWSLISSVTRTARPFADKWVKHGMVDASRAIVEATDRTPPKITGATPAQWSRNRGTITVGATGVADTWSGISHTSLYADGKYIGRDTTSPYAVKLDLSKRKGTVKLQWRVYDRAGNLAAFDRSITADNTPPGVKITSAPKDKAKVKGTVKIAVTATDYYGVNRVELLINGKKIQTDKTSPYAFSITASKQPKKMKVQVRAYDNAGNVKYAPTRNWTR